MRRPVRSALVLGLLAGVVLALLRVLARPGRPGPAPLAAPPPPLPATTPVTRTPVPVEIAHPTPAPDVPTPPAPAPAPEPVTRSVGKPTDLITASPEGPEAPWVEPVEGACPEGYPIKAKRSSGIYHRPGGLSYERTRPDRCYRDEAAAEADGFRAAKR